MTENASWQMNWKFKPFKSSITEIKGSNPQVRHTLSPEIFNQLGTFSRYVEPTLSELTVLQRLRIVSQLQNKIFQIYQFIII